MITSSNRPATWAISPTSDSTPPRVIRQVTSIFLVSRNGELWRVFDSMAPEGADRVMPAADSTRPYRMFVALACSTGVRVHTFAEGASRGIDSESLQQQLDSAQAD